jgi:uncharacterized protein (TIGR03000 family)
MRSASFRGGPSGMSRGWGGGENWNGRGNWEGRGWGREGDWGREGWARGGWGWWGPGLWGWGGGYYNPWYDDGYGYGGYANGGYPSDYSSFYSGPATYSEDAQDYGDQGPAGRMMANEDAAMIAVRVPPNADIWFDGQKTNQKGAVRQFETPALDPGHDYAYEVRARWNENGRNIERTRQVTVHAGDRIGLNFMESRGARGERPADYDRSGRNTDMRNRDRTTPDGDRQNRDRNGDDQIRDRTPQNNTPSNRSNQPPRPGNVPPPDTDR